MDTGFPPLRWATASDGASIAYQVFGDGPIDVVVIPPMAQNMELLWERSEHRRMFERVGSFARFVHFDKRGTGCSDRTVPVPGIDQHVDDARAVMDAAGVERGVLYGISEGGPMAVLFSVTYPARVAGLVLHATAARITETENYPAEQREQHRWGPDGLFTGWGTPECRALAFMGPSGWADPGYRTWHTRYQRHCATPSALRELLALSDTIDVRDLLPAVSVPTLVLHASGDPCVPIERARQTAAMIPGARFVEYDGVDHIPHIGDTERWLQEVERFVTGREPALRSPTWTGTTRIRTFGGFAVERDGETQPVAAWGSRQARLLCKRLAAAAGRPVRRDELIELMWPDDHGDRGRLSARLSVQLSTVRRLLDGGVIADRDTVRLDLAEVSLDLADFESAVLDDRADDVLAIHHGEFLPEDAYEQWAIERRDWARSMTINALRARAAAATRLGDDDGAIEALRRLLLLDGYDVDAHLGLIAAFQATGRLGEANRADDRYHAAMDDLGIEPTTPRRTGIV